MLVKMAGTLLSWAMKEFMNIFEEGFFFFFWDFIRKPKLEYIFLQVKEITNHPSLSHAEVPGMGIIGILMTENGNW